MSKDQNQNKKLHVENVDKLMIACKMINEIRSGLNYWKFNQIWPTNLYDQTLKEIVELLNQVLLSSDFSKEPKSVNFPIFKH